MNPIKKELEKELQSLRLSNEKKQIIFKKIQRKNPPNWTYRFILTAFIFLGIALGYFLKTGDFTKMNQAAKPDFTLTTALFSSETSKYLLLFSLFLLIYITLKVLMKNRTLTTCPDCSEEWTYGQSLKEVILPRKKINCPSCHATSSVSERTKWKMTVFDFMFPFSLLIAQFFDHILWAWMIYTLLVLLIFFRFTPYLLSFDLVREKDVLPNQKNQQRKKGSITIRNVVRFLMIMLILWGVWQKINAYPTPEEAILENAYQAILIPAYEGQKEALFFTITENKRISAHYANESIFGWQTNGFTSYLIEYKAAYSNNYWMNSGNKHLYYGLIKLEEDWRLQVNNQEVHLVNVHPFLGKESKNIHLKDLSIWYFESDRRLDLEKDQVQIIHSKTGEVVELLKFE